MRTEKKDCIRCGSEYERLIDEQGRVHGWSTGELCSTCSYDQYVRESEENESGYDEDLWDEDQDSGFLGSMLEAQLIRDGQQICSDCNRKISSILDKEHLNPCTNEAHTAFKQLFEIRVKIGLHDLKTRGFD